jgi:hypothetical protein
MRSAVIAVAPAAGDRLLGIGCAAGKAPATAPDSIGA